MVVGEFELVSEVESVSEFKSSEFRVNCVKSKESLFYKGKFSVRNYLLVCSTPHSVIYNHQ